MYDRLHAMVVKIIAGHHMILSKVNHLPLSSPEEEAAVEVKVVEVEGLAGVGLKVEGEEGESEY